MTEPINMQMNEAQMSKPAQRMEEYFAEVYAKFKVHFYQEMFSMLSEREATLTTVETLCVEMIYVLGSPTVNEFASFINISAPNAAYKVNSLINKGYIRKVRSEDDKREYHLMVTDKFYKYYNLSTIYVNQVMERIRQRFLPEQLEMISGLLRVISEELMPEAPKGKPADSLC